LRLLSERDLDQKRGKEEQPAPDLSEGDIDEKRGKEEQAKPVLSKRDFDQKRSNEAELRKTAQSGERETDETHKRKGNAYLHQRESKESVPAKVSAPAFG